MTTRATRGARWSLGALAAAAALALTAGAASARYPERDITWIIPYSPGGGMDSTSRALASVLPKYLGNTGISVVPKNLPGAGGRKGWATLHRAKGDGYTIGTYNMPGAALPKMLGEKVAYDLDEVVWIARMSTSPYLIGVSAKGDIKTFADLKKRKFKVGSTGWGATAHAAMQIVGAAAGLDYDFVTGYKGSKDYIVATVRGDVQVALAPTQTFLSFIRSGDIRPLVTFEQESSFKGVPTAPEVGLAELDGLGVHRLVAAPPGTPAEAQKALSDAIAKAVKDPEVQAWAAKTKRPFAFLPYDKVEASYRQQAAFFLKYKDALAKK